MSDGKGKEGPIQATSRPIIPTPSQSSPKPEQDDSTNMLKIYYSNYQKLKKENNTLTNQLAIIDREREELQERLDTMRVCLNLFRKNKKRREDAIAGLPAKSIEILYVL